MTHRIKSFIDSLPVPETLEEAIRERDNWIDSAAMFHRNEEYYRGLLDEIGHAIGEECLIADDGSRPGGILRAKLPDCVRSRLGVGKESHLPVDFDGPIVSSEPRPPQEPST